MVCVISARISCRSAVVCRLDEAVWMVTDLPTGSTTIRIGAILLDWGRTPEPGTLATTSQSTGRRRTGSLPADVAILLHARPCR